MANEQNLISFADRPVEERKAIARRGAEKANKIRRERKTLRQGYEEILSMGITEKNEIAQLLMDKFGIKEDLSVQRAMQLSMVNESINGNTKAMELIRDDIRENPDKSEENGEKEDLPVYIPAKDIGKSFVDLNRWIDERKYLEYWLEGGRASIKSSFWSEKVIELLENNPNMCAICIRKVGNTMKDSVFSQIQWGIDKISEAYPDIPSHWSSTKSPLEYKNKKTGQLIYFRGADDPGKIKSIKPPKDKYIGIVIYEEFDQMNGMEEVRKIDQSVVRGGNDFIIMRIYNTPKSNNHFVNKEKIIPKPNRIVHRSTYLDVPVEFLGQTFIDEAEYVKKTNPKVYENEYLGLATGDGGNVFENIELRPITDSEIESFDYLYFGLDFGWYPDPLAWTKMCYQPDKKTLYIFDEYVVNKMSNQDVWNNLKEEKKVTEGDLITADSAEPKSIADFQSYGSLMRPAKKGPDSVEYSMKWLASLVKIVIDPERCPRSAEEFTTYEFDTDRDGNYISKYVDKDNHCIDSVRYATNPIWRRKGE